LFYFSETITFNEGVHNRYISVERVLRLIVVSAAFALICVIAQVDRASAAALPGGVEEFSAGVAGSKPGYPETILAGPDGQMWYADSSDRIARMLLDGAITAEFTVPPRPPNDFYLPSPNGLALGPENNLWFTDADYDEDEHAYVGYITPEGAIKEFPLAPKYVLPEGIARGPEGDLWVADKGIFSYGQPGYIARVTPAGSVSEFLVPAAPGVLDKPEFSEPFDIATGLDGNMWFTDDGQNSDGQSFIGRVTPAGVITEFPIRDLHSAPAGIALGPDGNMWFTESGASKIGQITPAGVISEFAVPGASDFLKNIVLGPDGNMWFTENPSANAIGRITPDGAVTSFSPISASGDAPGSVTIGPDGDLWFTEHEASRIGRFVIPYAPANLELPVISGQAAPGSVLTVTEGSWSHEPTSLTYQWQDCDMAGGNCVNLKEAVMANHSLTSAEVGHTLRAVVTATNVGGAATAISNPSAVVVAPALIPNVLAPMSEPLPVIGSTMTWNFGWARRYTIVESLVMHGVPVGGVVEVTCRGKGCAFKDWRSVLVTQLTKCKSARCKKADRPNSKRIRVLHGTVSLAKLFASRHLKVGARIDVSVTKAGWVGKSFVFTIRANMPPGEQITCVGLGSNAPATQC
jgi:streptogramin lyase